MADISIKKGIEFMNIVFYIIVLLALVLIWFLIAFAFKPIGGFLVKLFQSVKNTMLDKENNEKEQKK